VVRPPDGKRNFLSLLQDESISDRYSVACGLSEVINFTNKIQVQISSANTIFLLEGSLMSMLKMPQCQESVA
jgi:hypothetical protein